MVTNSARSDFDIISRMEDNQENIDGLCAKCNKLQISLHKFLPIKEEIEARESPVLGCFDGHRDRYLHDLYSQRQNCSFCRLVYYATHGHDKIRDDGKNLDGKNIDIRLDWQLDGRPKVLYPGQGGTKLYPPTRRLRVRSYSEIFEDIYFVPLNSRSEQQDMPSFQGRICPKDEVNPALMRSWINLCLQHHKICETKDFSFNKGAYLRVIDVQKMCLVEIPATERYCTLSYCWGTSNQTILKKNMYAKSLRPGFFSEVDLPKTIRDAIGLVGTLGEAYIWIDAWCIFQDDPEEWASIAPRMDKIYGGSLVTICAASGSDSNFGLPGCKPQSRSLVQHIEKCGSFELLATRVVEDRIKVSPWNARAWTFQERLLSRRCLIFVDDRVFFQCREAAWSEELDCETFQPVWTIDRIGAPLTLFSENPVRRYRRSVELYSGRRLTLDRDRLVAWNGIALSLASSLQSERFPTRFYYGLPASHFDFAMLWELKERCDGMLSNELDLPTWSWCKWNAVVEWKHSTVSGILLNLHDWLENRTWIAWYVKSENGFEPIISKDMQSGASERWHRLGRWAGYSSERLGMSRENVILRYPHLCLNRQFSPSNKPMPGCLHFWTWSAHFALSDEIVANAFTLLGIKKSGLHRFSIVDSGGDWCGTIILNQSFEDRIDQVYEFIAISEAREFTTEEYDSWNYYVPRRREEAEWYLYYALMITWNEDHTVAERLGVAKIYQQAYLTGSFAPGVQWKEITLK